MNSYALVIWKILMLLLFHFRLFHDFFYFRLSRFCYFISDYHDFYIPFQTWASTILVVSHDRSFLNAVCTDITHLYNRKIDTYKGNYDQFDKTKDERIKNARKEYEAQKSYRDHIQVGGFYNCLLYIGSYMSCHFI